MTLRDWLDQHSKVAEVDYTYYGKDGNVEYGLETVEALREGNWDIPSDILNCEVSKAGIERVGGEVIAYVNVVSK